jgi:hypothetical protein
MKITRLLSLFSLLLCFVGVAVAQTPNASSTTPAAVSGGFNVIFQHDGLGNFSAYIPTGTYDASGAAAAAITTAETFATSAASTAQSTAETFATSAVATEHTAMTAAVAGVSTGGTVLRRLTHGNELVQYGDSITFGFSLAAPSTTEYGYLMSQDLGIPYLDRAITGDQACDIWPLQLGPHLSADSPTLAIAMLYSVLIGTNDVDVKGVGAYESVYNNCVKALISYLVTPDTGKVLPGNAAFVNTTGSNSVTPVTAGGITYALLSSTGTFTATITTTGNPIYVWQLLNDALPGAFTVSIDGGTATGPYSTQTTPAIATQNGGTVSTGLAGRFVVAAGTHTVAFNWVSGSAGIVGVGSISAPAFYSAPTVVVGQVPNQGPTGAFSTSAAIAEYNVDVLANVALIAGDGGDARVAYDDNYMLATAAEMTGGAAPLHPGPAGHVNLARSFEEAFQAVPVPPTSSSGALTFNFTPPGGTPTVYGNTSITVAASTGANFTEINPVALGAGALSSVTMCFLTTPSGSTPITVLVVSTSGSQYVLSDSFNVTPAATTGCQSFTAGAAYTARNVTSGEYLGSYAAPGGLGVGYATGGSLFFYSGLISTTPITATASSSTMALSATVTTGIPATTNIITLTGMTAAGHCAGLSPTNSTSATNVANTFISAKGSGQITITNPAVLGLSYDGVCYNH